MLLSDTWYNFDCVIYCVYEADATFKIKINRIGDLSVTGKVSKCTTHHWSIIIVTVVQVTIFGIK